MTDKKFTDEEIIKRLEQCVKRGNHNYDTDIVLDLINRLNAENEKLNIELKAMRGAANSYKAEIERLKKCTKCVYEYDGEITEYCVQGPCSNFKTVEQIKAEAYKEFAERLKSYLLLNEKGKMSVVSYEDIDNLLKEMVGEE